MDNDTKALLAAIRGSIAAELEDAARFRERVAEEYPEDVRNERSAHALRTLADELRSNDIYDDTPALRKLLELVTTQGIDPAVPLVSSDSDSGFNVSQYRFHDAGESDDAFLDRFAEAAEDWWSDGD